MSDKLSQQREQMIDFINPPDEARILATQLDHEMQRAGFTKWELCGVASRSLVTDLQARLTALQAERDGADAQVELVRNLIANYTSDCGCKDGSFIYGCTHWRRRAMTILTQYPESARLSILAERDKALAERDHFLDRYRQACESPDPDVIEHAMNEAGLSTILAERDKAQAERDALLTEDSKAFNDLQNEYLKVIAERDETKRMLEWTEGERAREELVAEGRRGDVEQLVDDQAVLQAELEQLRTELNCWNTGEYLPDKHEATIAQLRAEVSRLTRERDEFRNDRNKAYNEAGQRECEIAQIINERDAALARVEELKAQLKARTENGQSWQDNFERVTKHLSTLRGVLTPDVYALAEQPHYKTTDHEQKQIHQALRAICEQLNKPKGEAATTETRD